MLTEADVERVEFVRRNLIEGGRRDLKKAIKELNSGDFSDKKSRRRVDVLHTELLELYSIQGLTLIEEEFGSFIIGGTTQEGTLICVAKNVYQKDGFLVESYSGSKDEHALKAYQAKSLVEKYYPPLLRINNIINSASSVS